MKKNKVQSLSSFLFLVCIFIAFFYKLFFKGLIPIPTDITVGMYYPWINNNYGYPVRVPFKNATLTDTVSQFWIWRNWAIDNLKTGTIAIWNPYSLAGYPMSPWFHTILFQPLNLFYFIFPTTLAMGLIVAFQLLLILISTFIYFKLVTKSNLVALFGSIIFSFSAYSVGWLTWGTVTFSLATLPLILLFLEKMSTGKVTFINYILLSTSILLNILGGHPQTVFYCLLIAFLYYIFKLGHKLNLAIITSVLLGVLMAAFVILPSIDIVNNSIRNKDIFISNQNYGFLSFTDLITSLVSQNYFGNPGTQNYWGSGASMQEKLAGISIASIFLTMLYFTQPRQPYSKLSKFGIIIILLGCLLAIEYPLGWLIYYLKIPLLSTAPASRALILTVFGLTIISTESFLSLIQSKYSIKQILKSSVISLSLLLGLFIPLVVSHLIYPLTTQDLLNLTVSQRNLFLTLVLLLSSISIILIIKVIPRLRTIFCSLLIFIPLIEGFYFGWKYTPFIDPKFYFPTTEAINFVQKKQKSSSDFFRIEREKAEILPPNMWQAYNLASFSGYDPVYLGTYGDFLIKNKLMDSYSRYFENDQHTIKYFQGKGIKYLFVINQDNQPPTWTKQNNWVKVFTEKKVSVLENLKYTPPYGLINSSDQDKIKLISHQDNFWQFDIKNNKSSEFYLIENNHPSWTVTVNNQPKPLNNFQETFKSVSIPPGTHTIIFKYHHKLFDYGVIISLLSVLATIISGYYFSKK